MVADQSFGFSRSEGTARFTSFTASQQFAAWIVAIAAVVLSRERRVTVQWLAAAVAGVVLVANGSRMWLACYAAVLAVFCLVRLKATARVVSTIVAALALVVALQLAHADRPTHDDLAGLGRIRALLNASREGAAALLAIDTVGWRVSLYEDFLAALRSATTGELIFGHGTSSGYAVVTHIAGIAITDPNRAVHNEWLRVVHEWGIAGLCIWAAFVASVARLVSARAGRASAPLVVYAAGLFGATLIENVFASAGSGLGLGMAIVGGALVTSEPSAVAVRAERTAAPRCWRVVDTRERLASSQVSA
jgi:hypothetical protein